MQVAINQLKKGSYVELNGEVYNIVDHKHVKPGKGGAFVRTKLKNLKLSTTIDRTFRPNDKLEVAFIEKRQLQYLYSSGDIYEFMYQDTFDQVGLHSDQLGEVVDYLKENLEVMALVYKHRIISLEPPIFINMKITSTEPGIRGDTSRAGTKPATTETGMTISVPLFINTGDMVRIATRTKEYVERA